MDAPLGITFFKKVEIYQNIAALDKQYSRISNSTNTKVNITTWPIERKVLKWTYYGHHHLGTPLKTDDFSPDNSTRLAQFGLIKDEVKDLNLTILTQNFVGHGFAVHTRDGQLTKDNHNIIYFTKEGLLTGEVLNEIDSKLISISYWIWGHLWGHVGAWILLFIFFDAAILPIVYKAAENIISPQLSNLVNILKW